MFLRGLYAEAVVAPAQVEPAFLDGPHTTDKPIGILRDESRTETFREVLRADREPAGASGVHFGLDRTSDLLFRTYRVVCERRPIILITEKFPLHLFRALPE